ncbi:hypothetical protein CXG81DRAFT_11609, partial [Caulochytrium protostelioides]
GAFGGDMLGMLQSHLSNLVADEGNAYSETVMRRIRALKNLQDQARVIDSEFAREARELDKRFAVKYAPLYEQRAKIVSGEVEPTEAECEREDSSDEEADYDLAPSDAEEEAPRTDGTNADAKPKKAAKKEDTPEEKAVKGIPRFWLEVLRNCPATTDLITERDEPILAFLTDIRFHYHTEDHGFTLTFAFAENPYFTNKQLEKKYVLVSNESEKGGFAIVYDHAEGTEIHWNEGKNPGQTVQIKKQRHKQTAKVRTVKKTAACPTFFSFFAPPTPADAGDEEFIAERLEDDFDVGDFLKDKVIAHAIDWYTGKALDDLEEEEDADLYDDDMDSDEFEQSDEDD